MATQHIWAPWRMEFIKGPEPGECVFCHLLAENNDRENLILCRSDRAFVILNKYPYNNGHLMVVPNTHTASYEQLDQQTAVEMHELTQRSLAALGAKYSPQGFNLGMNLGDASGAGLKEHLHLHIVPRWIGDTNFMPVIAETKCMPQHLSTSYDLLAQAFESVGR